MMVAGGTVCGMSRTTHTPTRSWRLSLGALALAWVALSGCQAPVSVTGADERAPVSLNRKVLGRSLELGREFLLNSQKPAGNFFYKYNFVGARVPGEDSQVRQAGALWGVALIHHDRPTKRTAAALARGLAFYRARSRRTSRGLMPVYPGALRGRTGGVALLALATIEAIRSPMSDVGSDRLAADLAGYMKFLLSLRRPDGRFHGSYTRSGRPLGEPSPYFDGEALLAMVKAAKYAGHDRLRPLIVASAEAMHAACVTAALVKDPDSDTTKAYYSWGSMAYHELVTTGWRGTKPFAKRAIRMAYWMIDVHRTLRRRKNTAYAYEGMISAYAIARRIGDSKAAAKISRVVDEGLTKLTSWQVGGPMPNEYLLTHPTRDPRAVGGVMNGRADPELRIDVTQHQTHAVILARRHIHTR